MKTATIIACISLLFSTGALAEEYFFADDFSNDTVEFQQFDEFNGDRSEYPMEDENFEDAESFAIPGWHFLGCVRLNVTCRHKARRRGFHQSTTRPSFNCGRKQACYAR